MGKPPSRRYDSDEYLKAWQDGKGFPVIHDPITTVCREHLKAERVADVCCSTGILGRRLMDELGKTVIGFEMNRDSIAAGRAHGITHPVHWMKITRDTADVFFALLRVFGAKGMVARRCFSEIFATDQAWGREFATRMIGAGISELVLQGRQERANATHPIPSIREEAALVQPFFTVRHLAGECAYLKIHSQ